MKRITALKLLLVSALTVILLSGCVLTNTSMVYVNFPADKPDSSEHLFFRYSDGGVAQVPDAGAAASVTALTDPAKTIVGGYVNDNNISWVPSYSYGGSSNVYVNNIKAYKPVYAADHVMLAKQPEASTTNPGFISLTFAVYGTDNQLVGDRTEVFAHANPTTIFYNTDPSDINFKTPEVHEGFSSYTEQGLVTFLIKSPTPQFSSPISLYSGPKLIADNILRLITGITVSGAGGVNSLNTGDTLAMTAEITPIDAVNPGVVWSVVNGTGTATIDAVSGVLTAGDPGTVTVQAESTDGGLVTGNLEITIAAAPTPTPTPTPTPIVVPATIPVASVTIGGESMVKLGDSIQLDTVVAPAEATDQTVTWSVYGTGTGTISEKGLLTGTSLGTLTVKAAANDGSGVYGIKEITVIPSSESTLPTPTATAEPSIAPTIAPAAPSAATPLPTPTATPTPTPTPTPTSVVQTTVHFADNVVNINDVILSFSKKIGQANGNSSAGKFTDISSHWAGWTVETFAKLGIVQGYPDGGFRPDASITRAEFATLIAKAFDLTGTGKASNLSDISGHWAEASILNLQEKGLISGYPNGTFNPDGDITRSEMISIIYKIIDFNNAALPAATDFSDIDTAWNKDQIQKTAAAGIINGSGNGKFLPGKEASRAEALTLVQRVLQISPELKALLDTLK